MNADFMQDSIVESERREEVAKKREIESQLDVFRKQQYEVDHDGTAVGESAVEDVNFTWAVNARKRRKKEKEREKDIGGVKLRKLSSGGRKSVSEESKEALMAKTNDDAKSPAAVGPQIISKTPIATVPAAKIAGLSGLVAGYGSDSDDD